MSVGKKTIQYTAAAILVATAIIGASFVYIGVPGSPFNSSTSGIQGPSSTLVIQLTDPPHVPSFTTSLTLTYSSLALLVGEPSSSQGQQTVSTVTITPQGGNATIDLLKLQNLSQTIASATLHNGSVIYSVTFTVTGISIEINGTGHPVSLVSGGSTLKVVIADPVALSGTNVALVQLNPVVVQTANGYQMIPSAVGIIQHNHGSGESQVGSQHQLTSGDLNNLTRASGSATIDLVHLGVSNTNVTTVTVLVNNTGTIPIVLNGVGVHGNFATLASPCQGTSNSENHTETSTSTSTTHTEDNSSQSNASGHNRTGECQSPEHVNDMFFLPSGSALQGSPSASGCSSMGMTQVNSDFTEAHNGTVTLSPGECVALTFTGVLTAGSSGFVFVPSTAAGQTYRVSLIASDGAAQSITCVLPLGASSCTMLTPHSEQD